jgi:hypothetical protein
LVREQRLFHPTSKAFVVQVRALLAGDFNKYGANIGKMNDIPGT